MNTAVTILDNAIAGAQTEDLEVRQIHISTLVPRGTAMSSPYVPDSDEELPHDWQRWRVLLVHPEDWATILAVLPLLPDLWIDGFVTSYCGILVT